MAMGEYHLPSDLKIGHNVEPGYFAQNQAQLLDENLTVFEIIDNVAVGDIRTKICGYSRSFQRSAERILTRKSKCSREVRKTRLAMIKLLLEPVNLLIPRRAYQSSRHEDKRYS